MLALPYYGSTSTFYRIRPGVVLKSPVQVWEKSAHRHKLSERITNSFVVERQILEKLGDHPRIIFGYDDTTDIKGFLLAEASHGNLQTYIDENNALIGDSLRRKWCWQAAEAIAYLHENGVIHSDLRPENFLVHATTEVSLDLWLCDFGGSTCTELNLGGGHLPDDPFFDPTQPWISTPATDIFSLGSIFYTILTGHWPYKSCGSFETGEGKYDYQRRVNALFSQKKFPDVTGLAGGKVVMGCWMKRYGTVNEILRDLETEMQR
ncbi:kinase-like protein [Westerdykella ornata]|uniref:EKC/KEOPS complex subunit BUD32 n=1 Tax=Westerdykella ornata TaxID=318751 RepID=A0A6A6J5G4_WESOR|nr:kinase-like protein [Westerdykella ornata]KAF2271830.1 kinase-like protein [Westerdykella ornata]